MINDEENDYTLRSRQLRKKAMLKDMLRPAGEACPALRHADWRETFVHDGKTICVTPGGDHLNIINDNLRYFEQEHGNILVTAARTRGNGVERLKEYARSNGISIEWFKKSYDNDMSPEQQCAKNHKTAEKLLGMVNLWLPANKH